MVFIGPKGGIFRCHDDCREEKRELEKKAKGSRGERDRRNEVEVGGRGLPAPILWCRAGASAIEDGWVWAV